MSDQENKAAVYNMHEAISRGDLDGMFDHMTEDVTFRVQGNHLLGRRKFQGKEDIVENLLMVIFGRLQGGVEVKIENIAAENDKVFLQFSGKATRLSGEPYENEYVQLFEFRDGKISSITEFLDTALLAEVLG